jgi:hypothetical protein
MKTTARWEAFTEDELHLINRALIDSSSRHSDYDWHLRCMTILAEIVKELVNRADAKVEVG